LLAQPVKPKGLAAFYAPVHHKTLGCSCLIKSRLAQGKWKWASIDEAPIPISSQNSSNKSTRFGLSPIPVNQATQISLQTSSW